MAMKITRARTALAVSLALAAGTLGGCATEATGPSATPEPAATAPAVTEPAAADATADATGVIQYDGYKAAVVREGDTVTTVAERVGVPAASLAAYNGLRESTPIRAGAELVLPPS